MDNVLLAELRTQTELRGSISTDDIVSATKRYQDDVLHRCEVGFFTNFKQTELGIRQIYIYLRNEYPSLKSRNTDIESTCAAICKYFGHEFYKCYQCVPTK